MVRLSRRSCLKTLGLLCAASPAVADVLRAPAPPPRPAPVHPPDIAALSAARIAQAGLGGDVACMVAEARSGRVLFEHNADLALPPASVAKAVTAAYAFDTLGPGHRFVTRILATGPVRDGRLEGDLVLVGDGAPGLSSADLAGLAEAIKALGLREVTGRFGVWAGALPSIAEIDPRQPDYLGYNPSVSGLNLNFNRVHFEWRREGADYALSMDARAGGFIPQVSHSGVALDGRAAPIYRHSLDPETGREIWSVARGALGGSGARWLPVRDSALYAGDVFRTLARAHGLVLPQAERLAAVPQGQVLASLPSPPVGEIARGMLRYSTNLTAEVLGLAASGVRLAGRADSLVQSGAEMARWAEGAMGLEGARFVDHSGLGDASRVTAAAMLHALRRAGPDGALRRVLPEITLRDEGGRAEPFELRAKTGTLNFVSALAGYVLRPGRPTLVFAIFTAELARRAAIPPGGEANPPGSRGWTRRSRAMQYDLVRIWSRAA